MWRFCSPISVIYTQKPHPLFLPLFPKPDQVMGREEAERPWASVNQLESGTWRAMVWHSLARQSNTVPIVRMILGQLSSRAARWANKGDAHLCLVLTHKDDGQAGCQPWLLLPGKSGVPDVKRQ